MCYPVHVQDFNVPLVGKVHNLTYIFLPQDPSQRLLAMYSMSVLSETCAEVMKPVFAEFFPVFHRDAMWRKIGFLHGLTNRNIGEAKKVTKFEMNPANLSGFWREI